MLSDVYVFLFCSQINDKKKMQMVNSKSNKNMHILSLYYFYRHFCKY